MPSPSVDAAAGKASTFAAKARSAAAEVAEAYVRVATVTEVKTNPSAIALVNCIRDTYYLKIKTLVKAAEAFDKIAQILAEKAKKAAKGLTVSSSSSSSSLDSDTNTDQWW
ncbi:hypothetical protein AGMMS49593_08260 [Endomicrobiia bacterium]|nr:hypothetical protein AGMMS49593_08260 [Endomicrobiia bacterium]